ncbi:MAG: ABC transporter substrate-binding protein [Microthrixaceae bacterium]
MLAAALLAAGCTQDKSVGQSDDGSSSNSSGGDSGASQGPIKIGYSYLDFGDLVDKGLAAQGWGDQELAFQTFVDDLNANDGINGRQVEAVYAPYTPLGTEAAEAACLQLTEDEDVFAVVGGFLGPAEPANTCIAGQQETVLAGGILSEERLEAAKAPWIAERPLRTRQAEILFGLLEDDGKLDDAKVAVVTSTDAEDVRGGVIDTMGEFGVEPVSDLVSDAAVGDITAEDNVWATFAERIRSDDANTVLLVGNASAGIRNVAAQGLDVDVWVLDQETLTQLGSSVNLEDARGAVAAASMTGQDLWDDETAKECRDIYEKANPDVEIIEPDDLEEGDENVPQGVVVACRFLRLFQAVAENVEGDLTNDSFQAAADSLGDFSLPGQPFASLTADKHDANDSFRLVSFDPDIGQNGGFENLTDIADATP